jgi:hypothetical protein
LKICPQGIFLISTKGGNVMRQRYLVWITLFVLALLISAFTRAEAEIPYKMNYQGYLTDSNGLPVEGSVSMQFRICLSETGDDCPWGETKTVAISRGIYSVTLGETSAMTLPFDVPYYLSVKVGSPAEEMTPRKALTSAPYAFGAGNASRLGGRSAGDFAKAFVRTVIVSPVGTPAENGTALLNALNGISGASATNPYLLKIEPGIYDVASSTLNMKQYVDIEGSGESTTNITGLGGPTLSKATVKGADNSELRFLTVENKGGDIYGVAIFNDGTSPRLTHVTAIASGGSESNRALANSISKTILVDVTAMVFGLSITNIAILNLNSVPAIHSSRAFASGGSDLNIGIYNVNTSATISKTSVSASDNWSTGIHNYYSAGPANTVTIDQSSIRGDICTIRNEGDQMNTLVGSSKMMGGSAVKWGSGILVCAGVYDENYNFYPSTCP